MISAWRRRCSMESTVRDGEKTYSPDPDPDPDADADGDGDGDADGDGEPPAHRPVASRYRA